MTRFLSLLLLAAFAFTSCQQEEESLMVEVATPEPIVLDLSKYTDKVELPKSADGLTYEIAYAEYLTAEGSDEMGNIVFFNNRGNKQLGADFSPFLSGDGTSDISYYINENRPSADAAPGVTFGDIRSAMTTWEDVTCSDLNMFEIPSDGRPVGFVSAFFDLLFGTSFGGSFNYVADVTHVGFIGPDFFDLVSPPNGSRSILGVAYTLVAIDPATGERLDTNNDGLDDVSFREIYYNDNFDWEEGPGRTFDIETVALHEAGHGLSQAHFGKAFFNASGKVHFAPRAVMNATYSGVQTTIGQSDNAGHCSNWSNWPNK